MNFLQKSESSYKWEEEKQINSHGDRKREYKQTGKGKTKQAVTDKYCTDRVKPVKLFKDVDGFWFLFCTCKALCYFCNFSAVSKILICTVNFKQNKQNWF